MPPVWYKVLANDEHAVIAEGSVTTPITFVEDLRKAVYNDNRANLPNTAHTNLHVYPPNTTDFKQSPVSPKRKVNELLKQSDDTIILVARPPQQQSLQPPSSITPQRLEDPALVSFFHVLIRAEPNEQRILDFGNDHLFGDLDKQTKLFVRECYDELCDVIVTSHTRRSLLIGTPGIGKSLFGIYMLKKLIQQSETHHTTAHTPAAQQRRSVVWTSGRLNRCALFTINSNGDHTIDLMESEYGQHYIDGQGILNNANNWSIYDAIRPSTAEPKCRAMLISSPRSEDTMYSEWRKEDCITYYMPVWSDDEMSSAQHHIYNVPHHQYLPLRKVFGNIPRHVFAETTKFTRGTGEDTEHVAISFVKQQLTKASTLHFLNEIYASISKGEAIQESHYLMHVDVPASSDDDIGAPYTEFTVRFASFMVEELVMRQIESSASERQALWLAVSKDLSEYGSLRGILFERYAHRYLQTYKGAYTIKRLKERHSDGGTKRQKGEDVEAIGDELLQLTITCSQSWSIVSESADYADGTYAKPLSCNEKAIDALLQPDSLFQMTVSGQHGVLLDSVRKAAAVLHNRQLRRLYFVVPSDKYDEWTTTQPYRTKRGHDAKQTIANLQQYALNIDMGKLKHMINPD